LTGKDAIKLPNTGLTWPRVLLSASLGAMRRVILSVFAAFAVAPALAQGPSPPPGAVAAGPEGTLVMSSQVCDALAGEAGVPGADYRPGVDVHGKAVAPADLPTSTPQLETDNFPIEIDAALAGKFGLPAARGAWLPKAILGYVTVRDNQAYFNGQPLGEDRRAALIEACRAAGIK